MPYTPEQIQAALNQYRQTAPLSNPEGTWAAPNTAPLGGVPGTVDTTTLTPEAPSNPDWMAVARSYGPRAATPDQETGADPSLAVLPPPSTPQESLAAMRDASTRAAEAERARGEAQAQGFEREAQLADQHLTEMNEAEAAQAEQRSLRDAKLDTLLADAQKRSEEAANLSVYDRRSSGQIAAGAIGLALASLGDGFNRLGGNTQTNAMGMVASQLDRQLERDLQLQREAIEDKRRAAAAKFSELGIARQMNLDANGQDEMARVFMLRKQAAAMKSLAANTQAADARALAEQGAADREAKAATLYDSILDRNANTQANTEYKQGLVRSQRGKATGAQSSSFQTIQAKIAGGESLSPAELKVANSKAYGDWAKDSTKGEQEVIPGFVQDSSTTPISAGELPALRKRVSAAVGVEWLSNKLAGLYETVVDPASSAEARKAARSEYDSVRGDLLSGKSVQTGQGTITEGDAKRMAGSVPELPTNWLGDVRTVENFVRGRDPSAAPIRQIGINAREQLDTELAETYGIRRRTSRPAAQPAPAQSSQVVTRDNLADLD